VQSFELWGPLEERGIFFAPIMIWLIGLGSFALVTLGAVWIWMDRSLFKLYFPAVVVFVMGNFMNFQGDERQNILLFYPGWMTVAAVVFVVTLRRFAEAPATEEGKGVATAWASILFFCAVAAAILGFVRLRGMQRELWTSEMEEVGIWIGQNTPRKAVFVGPTDDYNVVATIAGKQMALASDRLVWLYSLKLEDKIKDNVRAVLDEPGTKDLLPSVRYVVNDGGKAERFQVREPATGWKMVHQAGTIKVFERKEG
jgi:hypothetical protein